MAQEDTIIETGKPCLFLSHSGVDSDAAILLKRAILATEAARHAGLRVWLDKDDLVPGLDDWQRQLEDALSRATAFAVLVGSKGVVNWVEREVRAALSRATGDDPIPFIPVLAKDSPGVSALPAFAQQHQGVRDPINDEVELQRLVAAVLSRKPGETPLLDEPFVGLRSMREEDAQRFFGRDDELSDLIGALKRHRLLAIVADSGAGKSSLAMAGLIPAYRGGAFADPGGRAPDRRAWHVVVMRPGDNPLEGLRRGLTEAAERMGMAAGERAAMRQRLAFDNVSESAYALRCDLPAGEAETLLVVDQFEELLVETPEPLRAPFVDFLLKLAALREPGGFRVLLTVRADYFNLCKPYPALYGLLAAAKNPAVLRLKRISDAGLLQAVRRPLELSGYRRTDDIERLARRTIHDLSDRPGDLALAQMALFVVWRRRRLPDGTLIDAYVDVGGVTGALAQEAERIRTEKLAPAEAALLAPLFARLVRLGDTGGVVRRICRRDELDPARLQLADRLCSDEFGRLLLAGNDSFEVCHEALVTQWPWLQDQLQRAAGDLRDFEPMMRRAADWATAADAHRPGYLATGAERTAFERLAGAHPEWLSATERDFVAASNRAHADELARREEERLARERAQNFRRWTTRGAFAAALLLAVVAGVAGWSAVEARRQAAVAEAERLTAEAAEAAAAAAAKDAKDAAARAILNETVSLAALSQVAVVEGLPIEAVKLALAGWPNATGPDRPQLRRVLAALANALPWLHERARFAGGGSSIAVSSDGSRFVTAWIGDGFVAIRSVSTGAEILQLPTGKNVSSASFAPAGSSIVTVSAGGSVDVWDTSTGMKTLSLSNDSRFVTFAAFSPDASRIVTNADDNMARIWDATNGSGLVRLSGHGSHVASAEFSSGGGRVVTASWDRTAIVWEAASGAAIARLQGHAGQLNKAVFSPDGKRVATASSDGTARLWDAQTGLELVSFNGNAGAVRGVAFSPDGHYLATGSDGRVAILWDVETGGELARFYGHEAAIGGVAFAGPGTLVTAGFDGTTRTWDASVVTDVARFRARRDDLQAVALSPDATRILVGSLDGSVWVLDAGTGNEVLALAGHSSTVSSVAFSPDGRTLLTASWDKTARLWDAETGQPIWEWSGSADALGSAQFSPDGKQIVTAGRDGTAMVWEAATRRPIATLSGHSNVLTGAWFDGDGKRVVTASWDGTARVWDAASGAEIAQLTGHAGIVNAAAFSPDGRYVIAASADTTARLWEVATGREVGRLVGHLASVNAAAFSPAGDRLLTASDDGSIRIWDTAAMTEIQRFADSGMVVAAAFSADGRLIVSATLKGSGSAKSIASVALWDAAKVDTGDGLAIACRRLGANFDLSATEQRYGLKGLTPICGANTPATVDWAKLR